MVRKLSKQTFITEHYRASQIRWGDVDANGLAHFDTYVRLMEETEYSFLRHCGLSVVLQDEKGTMGFPRLSAELSIELPVGFDCKVETRLRLLEIDGKRITYAFKITNNSRDRVATGKFCVACCRFPEDELPYAILTPEFVIQAITHNVGQPSQHTTI